MDDYPNLSTDERSVLELLDAAEVGHARRQFDQLSRLLDLGDRIIGQQAALRAIADPTTGQTPQAS